MCQVDDCASEFLIAISKALANPSLLNRYEDSEPASDEGEEEDEDEEEEVAAAEDDEEDEKAGEGISPNISPFLSGAQGRS